MGRIAAHTQEQVFKAANKLMESGVEVTPSALREYLGRGSFSTLGKHIEAWQEARKTAALPVILDMPEVVKVAFAQCWQSAALEAGKEIAAIRDKAEAEVAALERRLHEALSGIERLEEEANAFNEALDGMQNKLEQVTKEAQQAATDATTREASLIATVEQMRQQIESHKNELGKKHAEAELLRKQKSDEIARLNKDFSTQLSEAFSKERTRMEEVASSRIEVARLTEQLKDQKTRSAEVIGKLEKDKQTLETDLSSIRKEMREVTERLGHAQGEIETLKTQIASFNSYIG